MDTASRIQLCGNLGHFFCCTTKINDASTTHVNARNAGAEGFDFANFFGRHLAHVFYTILKTILIDLFQIWQFTFIHSHNQFSTDIVIDAMVFGKLNQFVTALDAIHRFERTRLIINAGVNYPAVITRLVVGQSLFFFKQKDRNFRIALLQFVHGSGTHDAASNDDDIELVFHDTNIAPTILETLFVIS